jgi:transcription initiation factor TFIIB
MSNILIVKNIKDIQQLHEQQQKQLQSHHHHSVIYDYENGEKICKLCGIVVQDKLYDSELDVDFYNHNSDTNTVAPGSRILNENEMSTTIADYNTKRAKRVSSRKVRNMIKFYSKVVSCSNKKRNLQIALDLLGRIKNKLSLTSVCIEDALLYYNKAVDKGLTKGRSIKEMIVACVYVVCKSSSIPRTLKEISQIVQANEIFASKCYRLLTRELRINHVQFKPSIFIRKIADVANISEKTVRESIDMLLAIQNETIFSGKNPLSLAAAILYITCRKHKQKISQAKVASAANVNIMTLRKRLLEVRAFILNTPFLN